MNNVHHYDADGDTEYSCGGDDDCDSVDSEPDCVDGLAHQWTREGLGGCDSNPGVWSLGGTTYHFAARCRVCGCGRAETNYGSQRNPGQCDTLRYTEGEHEPEADAVARARRLRSRRQRYAVRAGKALFARLPLVRGVTAAALKHWCPRASYDVRAVVARLAA